MPNAGGVPEGGALGPLALDGWPVALDGWSVALGGCSVASPTVSTLPLVLITAAEPAMAAEVNRNSRRDFDMLAGSYH